MFFPSLNIKALNYTELFEQILKNRPTPPGTAVETPKVPTAIPVPDQATPSLFALIIGINAYAHPGDARPLDGAVKDATDMRNYLVTELKVPELQIRFLLDDQAKRAEIIAGFQAIREDTRIKKDDPILIFFAGHGYEINAPAGWPSGDVYNQIQLLVPQDYSTDDATRVHGIPDFTLGALLNEIAEKHGDNITVIFDSCHSGSGTRGLHGVRGLTEKQRQPIPPTLDQDIWSPASRGSAPPPSFSTNGSSSHVLLAACNQKEEVADPLEGGNFTQALLPVLKTIGVDKLTYVSLLQQIGKLPGQNPQCEGNNRNRIIFDAKAPTTGRVCFPIKKNGTVYELQAGAAHGITQGTEFSLYPDSLAINKSKPLCILDVHSAADITALTTTLRIKESFGDVGILSNASCVLQTKAGDAEALLLYAPFDDKLAGLYTALAERNKFQLEKRQIRPILEQDKAKLGISVVDGRIAFDNLDERLKEYGLTRMRYTVKNDPRYIVPVLHGAANFYWHLNRQADNKVARSLIEIECHTLVQTEEKDESDRTVMKPVGDDHIKLGVLDVEASTKTWYGYTVTNKSTRDLYVNVFYFNNNDFSIVAYYTSSDYPTLPASPDNRRFNFLPLGYGSGGVTPFQYTLKDDVNIDVGYLVFFITDGPIDLSKVVEQLTPFREENRDSVQVEPPALPVYGTKLVKIVQRRAKA